MTTRKTTRRTTSIENLPFVGQRARPGKNKIPRCFWLNVTSTGDIQKDEDLGMLYAHLTLEEIKCHDFTPLLGMIVLDMIEAGCPQQIAAGFFYVIACAAMGKLKAPTAKPHLVASVQS